MKLIRKIKFNIFDGNRILDLCVNYYYFFFSSVLSNGSHQFELKISTGVIRRETKNKG